MKALMIFFILGLPLIAPASPYQLKGSYFFRKGEKAPVSFNVRWVEKDGQLTGFYSDDRFAERAPVSGLVSDSGRVLEVLLPRQAGGVKSISMLTSAIGPEGSGKSIPLELVTRDSKGNPLSATRINGQFTQVPSTERNAQAQEERPCLGGFGALAGYCGRYAGMVAEEYDSARLCDFMSSKDLRLEVDNEANVIFHTAQPDERHMGQDHLIGRIPSDSPARTVDIMSRHCRPLPGTTFPGDDCKRVNLIGTFSSRKGTPHFTGTYSIIDEKNARSCRYSMTLDRVEGI